MASTDTIPLKNARLLALAMAWAWAVVSGSVGLNALIKSNQQQSRIKHLVPPPTVISINVNDVFDTGVVSTTVSALIAVLCSAYALLIFLPVRGHRAKLSTRFLPVQYMSLGFCALWLLAAQVAFTQFFRTRSAQVHAFVGGIELPDSAVQSVAKSLGVDSVYRHIGYLRLVAILPWFTLLFTVIAAIVCFLASRRARSSADFPTKGPEQAEVKDMEKVQVEHRDEKTGV